LPFLVLLLDVLDHVDGAHADRRRVDPGFVLHCRQKRVFFSVLHLHRAPRRRLRLERQPTHFHAVLVRQQVAFAGVHVLVNRQNPYFVESPGFDQRTHDTDVPAVARRGVGAQPKQRNVDHGCELSTPPLARRPTVDVTIMLCVAGRPARGGARRRAAADARMRAEIARLVQSEPY